MIDVRPFNTLGGANHGWLNAKHHFSFAGYHDAKREQWGKLRVWNDDEIAAGTGFEGIAVASNHAESVALRMTTFSNAADGHPWDTAATCPGWALPQLSAPPRT